MIRLAVDLPWPSRNLHPNARVHHMVRARSATKARAEAAWEAKAAGIKPISHFKAVTATAIFYPPDNRRRDRDGMMTACKAYFDGIADVLGIDDFFWDFAIKKRGPMPNGAVRIEIEVAQ